MLHRRWLALLSAVALPLPGAAASLPDMDLRTGFGTASPWRLTVRQGPDMPDPVMDGTVPGPIALCLSRDGGRHCDRRLEALLTAAPPAPADDLYARPHYLEQARVVRGPGQPILWLVVGSLHGVNGDQRRAAVALAYRSASDRFTIAYRHLFGRNTNDTVRLVERSPIAGAIVSADPTRDAPFGYRITVSRPAGARYVQSLRFRSATRYGDGNPLSPIDSEMPEILRRLGLWRPGQALPLPDTGCPGPHLVRGALWCGPAPTSP